MLPSCKPHTDSPYPRRKNVSFQVDDATPMMVHATLRDAVDRSMEKIDTRRNTKIHPYSFLRHDWGTQIDGPRHLVIRDFLFTIGRRVAHVEYPTMSMAAKKHEIRIVSPTSKFPTVEIPRFIEAFAPVLGVEHEAVCKTIAAGLHSTDVETRYLAVKALATALLTIPHELHCTASRKRGSAQ